MSALTSCVFNLLAMNFRILCIGILKEMVPPLSLKTINDYGLIINVEELSIKHPFVVFGAVTALRHGQGSIYYAALELGAAKKQIAT